jgi:hypothetical protein
MSSANKNNNSSSIPLKSATEFIGLAQSTSGFSNILVNIRSDKKSELTIQQSADKVNWDLHSLWTCDPAKNPTGFLVQEPASMPFFRVKLLNTSGEDMTRLRLVSVLNLTSNVKLNVRQDNTLISGEDELGEKHTLLTDASGALIVNSSGGGSSVVTVDNFPATQTVDGTVAISNSSFSTFSGANTDFAFYPDASNSTVAIYADGQQPTQTTAAGWVYTNNGTAPNKINWYVFQDVTLPQYLVSEMESIYFVITQLPTATTLPFISFYTMPNGIDDLVPNFAKSSLVFAPSGAVPTTQGEYLFYVSSDPTTIRPEITNRYQLTFVADQSSKTLAQAAGERLSLATLSTGSTDPAGSNYFLFQQYGIVWAKTSVYLPVDNDRLLTTETNSGAISTTLTSLNGKVTACNTGAISGSVSITGTVEEMNSTSIYNTLTQVNGKVVVCDTGFVGLQPSYGIISFDATNTIVKRAVSVVADKLLSLNYYNDAGSVNFVLVYNLPVASVTVGTTTPIAVFALGKNQGDTIDLHRLLVTTAITLAVSGSYDGTALPHGSGAYLTVSFLTA